jgi:hypothetical protein
VITKLNDYYKNKDIIGDDIEKYKKNLADLDLKNKAYIAQNEAAYENTTNMYEKIFYQNKVRYLENMYQIHNELSDKNTVDIATKTKTEYNTNPITINTWNLYTFIAEKTLEPLIELRKSIHGIPIGVFESEEEMDKDDSSSVAKRWEGQIDEMIFAFKFAMAIGNEEKYKKYLKEVDMPSSDYDYSSEEERENYRAKYEIANKRAQKGFENFGKYYMCLYD